jgi:hypothetical protein
VTRRIRPSAVATRAQTRALATNVPDVVATLRAEVPAPPVPHGRPALLLMMGFPGTGKSHCARLLARRLGAANVASDALRGQLFVAASYADEENAAVFKIIDGLVESLIVEGHRVIVDATHLRRSARASMAALAARRGIPISYVLVTADEAEVLARLAGRARARSADDRSDADERVYLAMRARGFEEPDGPYVTVRSGPSIERDVDRIARELGERWSAAT